MFMLKSVFYLCEANFVICVLNLSFFKYTFERSTGNIFLSCHRLCKCVSYVKECLGRCASGEQWTEPRRRRLLLGVKISGANRGSSTKRCSLGLHTSRASERARTVTSAVCNREVSVACRVRFVVMIGGILGDLHRVGLPRHLATRLRVATRFH